MTSGILQHAMRVCTCIAAGMIAACPVAAQDTSAGEAGPLRFLRPSVGTESEPPRPTVPAQAEPTGQIPAAIDITPPELATPKPATLEAVAPEATDAETTPMPDVAPEAVEPPDAALEIAPAVKPMQLLRLGVLAGRDAGVTLTALGEAASGLSQALGRPVEFLPMSSYGAMIDAQRLARIDGGFYSAAAYARVQFECRCLEPLVAPAAEDGTTGYYSILVTHSDSRDAALPDLRGKTVASGASDSIGARRMPLAALLAEGVDARTFFAPIRDAGSAEQAVRLMLSGDVDAAFAWTSFAGDSAEGYSRGTLADLVARDEIDMSEVSVVWRSPFIAHGPFAVGPAVSDAEKTTIKAYLLDLHSGDPAAYDALNPFYAGGYVGVGPKDYAGVAVLAEQDVDAVSATDPPASYPP